MMTAQCEYEQFKSIATTYSPNFNVYYQAPENGEFMVVGVTGANQIAFTFRCQPGDQPSSFTQDFPTAILVDALTVS
jgi:hypothetical protein